MYKEIKPLTKEALLAEFDENEREVPVKFQMQSMVNYNGLAFVRKGNRYFSTTGEAVTFDEVLEAFNKKIEQVNRMLSKAKVPNLITETGLGKTKW